MNDLADRIEKSIRNRLESNDIYAFSIIFTYEIDSGLLAITLFDKQELNDLLKLFGYNTLCDKSGYTIIEDTNTVLLTGMALWNSSNL